MRWSLCAHVILHVCISHTLIANEAQYSKKMNQFLQETQVEFIENVLPKLEHYCMDCHDPDEEDEVLFLEQIQTKDILHHRHLWRSVAAQLRNRTMPPKKKKKQPSESERLQLASWIDGFLNASALSMPEYAGAVTSRRLNRNEYNNTIRDLLGLDLKYSHSFPVDSSGGEGFDNHAQTLYLPPILMEKYMEAAQEILDEALPSPEQKRFMSIKNMEYKKKKVDGKDLHSYKTSFNTYSKGEVEVRLIPNDLSSEHEFILKLDGIKASKFKFSENKKQHFRKFTLSRGIHTLAIESRDDVHKKVLKGIQVLSRSKKSDIQSSLGYLALFVQPKSNLEPSVELARKSLENFMLKAFRRPVRQDEVETYLSLYQRAIKRGDPFEEALKLSFKAVLVSPHFIFRIESPVDHETLEPVLDYELASRLSYFLWASMPDKELFDLAKKGILHETSILRKQVQRMLEDKKSFSFYESFVSQWLGTSEVGGAHAPDGNSAKLVKYRPELGVDLRHEPIHLFKHMVDQDRNLLEMIDSNYVVVNERLAKHYGIKNVKGEDYRVVALKNEPRGGVLGLGGVHMATSLKHRTSPVKRGAWVIETLLGTPVPPPPDDVPLLDEKKVKHGKLNLKQMYEEHRRNDACSACHNLIDPIGLGLENFNFVGGWREKDKNIPIDASGVMPNGDRFNGPQDLKKLLMKERETFVRHLTRKLLGYAIARQINDYDAKSIEQIVEKLKKSNFSSKLLIEEIVLSTPFLYKQKPKDHL